MPSESPTPRSGDAFRWWLLVSAGVVLAAAQFSAGRLKPAYWFLPLFGMVTGLVFRVTADALEVPRTARLAWPTMLLVGCGGILCLVPSYHREAQHWNERRAVAPEDPLAAAMMNQLAREDPEITAVPRYTPFRFLARRYQSDGSIRPLASFGAEWAACICLAMLCVRTGRQARDAA